MAVAGYEYRINGGAVVGVGNVLTTVVSGLTANTPYAFEVRAYDVAGNRSAWSPVSSVTTAPAPAAAITLIASKSKTGGAIVNTTLAINTTGASLLVVALSSFNGGGSIITLTDSKANVWTSLTPIYGGTGTTELFYCPNPIVGSGHTFTATGSADSYGSIAAAAFNNTFNGVPDSVSGAGAASGTIIQPGSLTPSVNNCLLVTGLLYFDAALGLATINSGFTIAEVISDINNNGIGLAYKVQTTAAAVNPTWTSSGAAAQIGAVMAAFKHV